MIYLKLFLTFLQVGVFGFGDGYASIPLIQSKIVDQYQWLTLAEFGDLVSISQMTTGPIVVNTATFVGTRIAGPLGAVIATLGSVLPSIVIVSLIAFLYKKYQDKNIVQGTMEGVHPVVVGLIGSAALSLLLLSVFQATSVFSLSSPDFIALGLATVSFVVLRKFKLSPMLLMLFTALAGLLLYGGLSVV